MRFHHKSQNRWKFYQIKQDYSRLFIPCFLKFVGRISKRNGFAVTQFSNVNWFALRRPGVCLVFDPQLFLPRLYTAKWKAESDKPRISESIFISWTDLFLSLINVLAFRPGVENIPLYFVRIRISTKISKLASDQV